MHDRQPSQLATQAYSRREMLRWGGMGIGWLAMHSLLAEDGLLRAADGTPAAPPRQATARSVIFLLMAGGPSHIDTFDPKPELTRLSGEQPPESILKTLPRTAVMGNGTRTLLASPFKFTARGQCGQPVSDLFNETGALADELCVIRSLRHDNVIHIPSEYLITTGTQLGDRPSLGAWVLYGLGSENRDLPRYVVLGNAPPPTYGQGFLPVRYQGTRIANAAQGLANLTLPVGTNIASRQRQLQFLEELNRHHRELYADPESSELEARIRSYELAARMQTAAPEAFDLSRETAETRGLYGVDQTDTATVGAQCLLARRLVERGVRFVQVRVDGWDSHDDILKGHTDVAKKADRPIAGLLADLKRSGLLDSTLVLWGGEFGRTPGAENGKGRDHSPSAFTMWLAGGGVRGGQAIGAHRRSGLHRRRQTLPPE